MNKALCIYSFGLALALSAGTASATLIQTIQDGADRLVQLQYTDGQWGFPLNAPPTYGSLSGSIAQGLINAYALTNDSDYLNAAKDAGNALVGETADWVGTYNPEFLVDLSDATGGGGGYLAQADLFFSELSAGTYTRQSVDYGTAAWITQVQNGRSGSLINARAYEFSTQAIAAARVGTTMQRDVFIQATKDGINTLNGSLQWNLMGLAAGVRGLALLGETFDPVAGAFAAANSVGGLADMLAAAQNANGSWYSSGGEDLQTTAFAMLGLLAVNDLGFYDDEILRARNYLADLQLSNGGWLKTPGGSESANVDGNIVWALAATAHITAVSAPSPSVPLGVVIFVMVMLALRQGKFMNHS